MEPTIFNFIKNDQTVLERKPLEKAAINDQLMAYFHEDFWQCMDTRRDKQFLEALYKKGAPWIR